MIRLNLMCTHLLVTLLVFEIEKQFTDAVAIYMVSEWKQNGGRCPVIKRFWLRIFHIVQVLSVDDPGLFLKRRKGSTFFPFLIVSQIVKIVHNIFLVHINVVKTPTRGTISLRMDTGLSSLKIFGNNIQRIS